MKTETESAPKKKGTIFKTPLCRISYPTLITPRGFSDDDKGAKYYSADFLFDKDLDIEEPIRKALKRAKIKKFGADKSKWPKKWKTRVELRDGDAEAEENPKHKKEYAGYNVLKATNRRGPIPVYTPTKELATEASYIVGGYNVYAVLEAVIFQVPKTRIYGETIRLLGVQRATKKGTAFDSSHDPEQYFSPLEGAEDEDDESVDDDSDSEENDEDSDW